MSGRHDYRLAIAAPSAPPAPVGGVASAHYSLYRSLVEQGCRASLLTYNETARLREPDSIIREGASPLLRRCLAAAVAGYLKLCGSRKRAHQLHDIALCYPGAMRLNRHLERLDPDLLVIPDRGAPALALRRRRTVVVQVVHHVPSRFVGVPGIEGFCEIDVAKATRLEQKALQQVDVVVCPSDYIRKVFERVYSFDGRVLVIPNLIDVRLVDAVAAVDLHEQLGLVPEAPVVYIPSAGSELKGARHVPELIRAITASYGRPIGFYLSGEIPQPLRAGLAGLPAHARLHHPGRIDNLANLALVKGCSFGVSPTLIENFSMALLEAGCCGLPMVTFDVGGNRELVAEGVSGFLAPAGEVGELAAAAAHLLDDRLCSKLRINARNYVLEHFSAETVSRRYLELFSEVLRPR